jgi:ATP-dependent Clp protease adapter protein ClpS
MSHTVITLERNTSVQQDHFWQVILYNCECHTFEEVVERLMLAIRCAEPMAWQYAQVVHTLGSVSVFKGPHGECERVADIIGQTGIVVEVVQ